MKGVFIRDKELPRFCGECFGLGYYDYDIPYCAVKIDDMDTDIMAGRQSWCPLVEVDDAWFSHHPQKNIWSKLP